MPLSSEQREELQNRFTANQPVKGITETMGVYRLKRQWVQPDGTYVATDLQRVPKQSIDRQQLLDLSEIVRKSPKISLRELRQQSIEDGIFDSSDSAPDKSTIFRRLKTLGYVWKKARFEDPRAKRSVIQFERCCFRQAQQRGDLDPEMILRMDESNYYENEQQRFVWQPKYKPVTLEKKKGRTRRASCIGTIGYKMVDDEAKAFIHLVFIPNNRRSFRPLPDRVQAYEIDKTEKKKLKEKYTKQRVEGFTSAQMKTELKSLGLRAPENTKASMKDVLLRVGRTGSRENELRCRGCGRPDQGGSRQVPTGDARGTSEYLSQNLGVYINSDGDLWNPDGAAECEMTIDEAATRTCPDYGKMEFRINPQDRVLLWDSSHSHLPNGPGKVSPFETFVQNKLNLKGVAYSPPYSPWFNPIEYFWAHNKQKVRHIAPKTQDELWNAIKTAAESVTGEMIKNWFKLANFDVGEPRYIPVDPNEGKNRCNLPADAKLLRREHVVCVDRKGVVRREKKPRHTRWSKYDKKRRLLQEVSVVKKAGVPRAERKIDNCAPPTDGGKTRWVGIIRPSPPDLEYRDYEDAGLFHSDDDSYAIEAIIDERGEDGDKEFKVKWVGYDQSHDSWLSQDKFSVGFHSLLREWRARNKRERERREIRDNKRKSKPKKYKPNRKPKVGDTVILKAPRGASTQFYVVRVLSLEADGIGRVHWYDAPSVDRTWKLQYLAKKGKGTAGPYVQSLNIMRSIVDTAPELTAKNKGKLDREHIEQILELIRS